MSKRIGGLPLPVVVVGGIAAVLIGLYLRNKLSSSSPATSTAAPAAADTGAGGASGGGSTTGPDLTPFEDLANSISGLTSVLGSGTFQPTPTTTPDGSTTTPQTAPAPVFNIHLDVPPAPASPAAPGPSSPTLQPTTSSAVPPGQSAAIQAAAGYSGGAPAVLAPNLGSQDIPVPSDATIPDQVSGSGPITVPPSPAPTPGQVTAGQKAVNEKPVITPHGRAI